MPTPPERDHQDDEQRAARRSRGPAIPTVSLNAAEQDPDPSEATSDSTAPQRSKDYDNDREDLPGGSGTGT